MGKRIIDEWGERVVKVSYLPTPEQIEKVSAEIRKSWSKKEYVIRSGSRGGDTLNYLPMTVHRLHMSREALSKARD